MKNIGPTVLENRCAVVEILKTDFSADFKRSAPETMGRRCTPQNRTKNLKGKSYKNPFNPCNLWS